MKHCSDPDCAHFVRHAAVAEFLDSATRCSDCGAELADGEAPQPEPATFRELVTVYEAGNGVQAHLVKAALENADIPVHISGEALLGAVGELPPTMSLVRVQVPTEFAERARALALACDSGENAEL